MFRKVIPRIVSSELEGMYYYYSPNFEAFSVLKPSEIGPILFPDSFEFCIEGLRDLFVGFFY